MLVQDQMHSLLILILTKFSDYYSQKKIIISNCEERFFQVDIVRVNGRDVVHAALCLLKFDASENTRDPGK